ncbi:hypothetical protein O3M35_008788 [Rhynocoris fuscipes]|uniref:UBX domain-containing protein 11 n=1 Tax=Rhynocoris fuscipes TaxID=488301 RepID=A0AAW1DCR6_9HEMI
MEIIRLNRNLGRRSSVTTNNPNIRSRSKRISDRTDFASKTHEELVKQCKKFWQKIKEMERVLKYHGIPIKATDEDSDVEGSEKNEKIFSHTNRKYIPNFEKVFSSIDDLNIMASEPQIVHTRSGATFKRCELLNLTLYKDGMVVENTPFRQYTATSVQQFFRDIEDGYYPTELKGAYPQGVVFKVVDNRDKTYSEMQGFYGKGQRLGHSNPEEFEEPPNKNNAYERKVKVKTSKKAPKEVDSTSDRESTELGASPSPSGPRTLDGVPPPPPSTPVSYPSTPDPVPKTHLPSVPPTTPDISDDDIQPKNLNLSNKQPDFESDSESSIKPQRQTISHQQVKPRISNTGISYFGALSFLGTRKSSKIAGKESNPSHRKESKANHRHDEESGVDLESDDRQRKPSRKDSVSSTASSGITSRHPSDHLDVKLPTATASSGQGGQDSTTVPYNITNIDYREGPIIITVIGEGAAQIISSEERVGNCGGGGIALASADKVRCDDVEAVFTKEKITYMEGQKRLCVDCRCGCLKTFKDTSGGFADRRSESNTSITTEYTEHFDKGAKDIEKYLRNNPVPPPSPDDESPDDEKGEQRKVFDEAKKKKKKKKTFDPTITYEHFQFLGISDKDEEGEESGVVKETKSEVESLREVEKDEHEEDEEEEEETEKRNSTETELDDEDDDEDS